LRDITVKTTHAPLVAKVGGSQLKLATSSKLADARSGFGMKFSASRLVQRQQACSAPAGLP